MMLNWMHVPWIAVISAAAVLGCFHLQVWARQRDQLAPALVAALSILVAFCGVLEMQAFGARTVEVYADALRWAHSVAVLIALIVNAADAMADASERRLTLSGRQVDEGVLLEVSDVGTGIPAVDLERIFQAFVSSKPDGLGFGLPLCRTLAHAHGGRLWATNNEGPGATFHVLLPIYPSVP